ncbi:DUF5691 domain-containing protein [Paenarthrobacter nitroguajacolicus]|uniref:DUF5691 domain-containing protein n=1 Tax=Paenarthrobacter nitroguajacolicus TaxID=211146 RepID=UPI00248BAE87|nr:DUF5691 domain-containing protein [Paenarthrobacter nitroguajacolicus]MDI2035678.1 hypothetical protein [Paenarthrobacter nitroguajacolicus]
MKWTDELRTAALVGTGRHDAPAPPVELGARPAAASSREESLLDQAALVDVVRRASRTAASVGAGLRVPPAPTDTEPQATGEAARLLELLLRQPPVGLDLRNQLLVDWLRSAAQARRRVPHRLLPALFAVAENTSSVFRVLDPAIGTRGRWLQDVSTAGLAHSEPRRSVHEADEAAPASPALDTFTIARQQLSTEWNSLSARARASHLKRLGYELHDEDEGLLEKGLDDKAKSVREVAIALLDRLPRSARAGRMAARLLPLLQVKGLLNKRFDIDLPEDPDAAALRDGIPSAPRSGEPDRLARLDTIILGAPLDVWTSVSGRSPEATAALLKEEPRVLALLTTAATSRNHLEWVRALLTVRTDARLLHCLPADERELWLERHIRAGTEEPDDLASLLRDLPQPWGPALAGAVLGVISGKEGTRLASMLFDVLPTALPPEAAEECRRLLERTDDPARRRVLRDAVQYQSFRQSLTEAFR